MNHIDYDTASRYFRKQDQSEGYQKQGTNSLTHSFYILTDFEIKQQYETTFYTILPSIVNRKGFNNISFTSKVELPEWLNTTIYPDQAQNGYLTILASLLSFISGRHVESQVNFMNLDDVQHFASRLSLQKAGPGAIDSIAEPRVHSIFEQLEHLIGIVNKLDLIDYRSFIRACKLSSNAHRLKRIDVNLGYSLLVSSIESISADAIPIDRIKSNWQSSKENILEAIRITDIDDEYRNLISNCIRNSYSSLRFREFIKCYLELDQITIDSKYNALDLTESEQFTLHQSQILVDPVNEFIRQVKNLDNFSQILQKVYKIDFEKLIKNTYNHRSKYYHEGHSLYRGSSQVNHQYLKEIINLKSDVRDYIISFEFLSKIASNTIVNYLKQTVKTQ